jgi:hypothetical protein
MVDREARSFFNVELVQRDVGNWSYFLNDTLKEVVNAYDISLGLDKPKKGTDEITLQGSINKAFERVGDINKCLTLLQTINMTTDVRTPEDCRRQLSYFNALSQKKFFKCPPFSSLQCKCDDRRAKHYRRNMLDGLWFVKASEIKVEIKEEYTQEGTFARRMVELNNDYDPKIMVGPLLCEGDRFNMMMCFASMAQAVFGSHAVSRFNANKRIRQDEDDLEDGDDDNDVEDV